MRTVLVIDDDPDFRAIVGEWLQQAGWRVIEAADGRHGVELAEAHRPEVVLCDLLMTPMNGFQVCRALRRLEFLRKTRLILISGRDFTSDRRAALEAGADDYLTKPFEPSQLAALLLQVAAPSASQSPPAAESSASAAPVLLRFWGVRGSIPTPGPSTLEYGGNTSCLEVRAGGQIIILDAGTGLRLLGQELMAEFGEQPLNLVLLLTHTHWDHIQGLPFFPLVYRPHNRLRILGYEGARHGLHAVLSSQMESPFFPVGLPEVPANISIEELKDLSFNLGPVHVKAMFANHPGICVGYRLFASGRSITFFPDNELRQEDRSGPEPAGAPVPSREFVRQEKDKMAEFLRGSDILVMDAQYDQEEYQKHLGWGHGCMDEVVALALQAEVKQLFLFHHDPDHDDKKIARMCEDARKLVASQAGSLRVDAAREGLSVELPAANAQLATLTKS